MSKRRVSATIYVETTICDGCEKRGTGAWPFGWMMLPIWGTRNGTLDIISERALCADCRKGVKPVQYRTKA